MPIPNAVSNRLAAELAAVDANTDLDLLISLIDVGQRSGSDITVAATELLRRANLVDSGTSAIVTSKIAAGLFKIDYPVADLWGAAAGGGGGVEVGQLVSGYFTGNPKYVPANGSRYLLSAYPDMTPLLTAGALPTYYEPVQVDNQNFLGQIDGTSWREMGIFTDGDVIFVPQTPVQLASNTTAGFLMMVSTDRGITWKGCLQRSTLTPTIMPEFGTQGIGSSSQILSVCKLSQPGHYGALLAAGATSGNVYYIFTEDYGTSWKGISMAMSSQNFNIPTQHSLYFRNGVLLYIGSGFARYSTTAGATWTSLADATWATGNLALYHHLTDDGFIIHTNQTTSVISFQWPATAAGWNASLAFTTTASKLAVARQYLKKCGGYWFAFSPSSNMVYIATSLLGTYVASAIPGVVGFRDVELQGSNFVLMTNYSTGYAIAHAPAGGTIANVTLASITDVPQMQDVNAALRWPLLSARFPITMAGNPVVLFRHGRESLTELIAPTGANNTRHLVTATPNSQYPHICRKYDMWFCSIPTASSQPQNVPANDVELGQVVLHYRSTDGKNWQGIGRGWSGIIDAGSRLLRLDGAGRLQQSTDGILWNTTGIAQPNIGTTTNAARLWRFKDVVYYYVSNSATTWGGYLYATLNAGNTWASVTGITAPSAFVLVKCSLAFYNGKYYASYCYNGSSPTVNVPGGAETYVLQESSDGIAFATTYQTNINTNSFDPTKAMIVVFNNILWLFPGSMASSNYGLVLVTGDGRNLSSGMGSSFDTRMASASIRDVDCSNGDMRWMFDELVLVGSTSHRVLNVYKGEALEMLISYPSGNPAIYVSGVGGGGGHYMGVTNVAALRYSPESAAFLAPVPNAGTSPMASPFLRVAA